MLLMNAMCSLQCHVVLTSLLVTVQSSHSDCKKTADMIGAQAHEIHFTASGTESDHWAVWGSRAAKRRALEAHQTPHVVSSTVEHPAVLQYLNALQHEVCMRSVMFGLCILPKGNLARILSCYVDQYWPLVMCNMYSPCCIHYEKAIASHHILLNECD
jgi:hypothetical protein